MRPRDWRPALCCGIGGGLGALFGWGVSGNITDGRSLVCAIFGGLGAILGAYVFALIE
jgi:hypothetical protein